MGALYLVNSAAELYVGLNVAGIGINLIFRFGWVWAVSEFNPFIFGLTVVIFAISLVAGVIKDPLSMDWIRQCLWGAENNYENGLEEIENFKKALIG